MDSPNTEMILDKELLSKRSEYLKCSSYYSFTITHKETLRASAFTLHVTARPSQSSEPDISLLSVSKDWARTQRSVIGVFMEQGVPGHCRLKRFSH